MEKRHPHYPLTQVKTLVNEGNVRATRSAFESAIALGFDLDDMKEVILNLTLRNFYKSMTTKADHTIWQDVYRISTNKGEVYLKLTVIQGLLIVSFKEL